MASEWVPICSKIRGREIALVAAKRWTVRITGRGSSLVTAGTKTKTTSKAYKRIGFARKPKARPE